MGRWLTDILHNLRCCSLLWWVWDWTENYIRVKSKYSTKEITEKCIHLYCCNHAYWFSTMLISQILECSDHSFCWHQYRQISLKCEYILRTIFSNCVGRPRWKNRVRMKAAAWWTSQYLEQINIWMFKYEYFDLSLLTNAFDDAEAVCDLGAVSIIQEPERRKTTGMDDRLGCQQCYYTKMKSSWYLTCSNSYRLLAVFLLE